MLSSLFYIHTSFVMIFCCYKMSMPKLLHCPVSVLGSNLRTGNKVIMVLQPPRQRLTIYPTDYPNMRYSWNWAESTKKSYQPNSGQSTQVLSICETLNLWCHLASLLHQMSNVLTTVSPSPQISDTITAVCNALLHHC